MKQSKSGRMIENRRHKNKKMNNYIKIKVVWILHGMLALILIKTTYKPSTQLFLVFFYRSNDRYATNAHEVITTFFEKLPWWLSLYQVRS